MTDVVLLIAANLALAGFFGLKIELMACTYLVGGTTYQSFHFPDLLWKYQWYEKLTNCLYLTSVVPQPFLLMIASNFALTGFWGWKWSLGLCHLGWRYNGTMIYFSSTCMIVSMIWNTSELSALHLSCATAIFVDDCCHLGPNWIFGLKMELMACAGLVGGTME